MTATVRITRRATFAAAHILCRDDWSDEKNREVFGACTTDHGHNYVVEVTVGGPLDAESGMVVNFKRGVIPTAENVALAAFHRLEPHLKPARLLKVRVVETENNAAEVIAD